MILKYFFTFDIILLSYLWFDVIQGLTIKIRWKWKSTVDINYMNYMQFLQALMIKHNNVVYVYINVMRTKPNNLFFCFLIFQSWINLKVHNLCKMFFENVFFPLYDTFRVVPYQLISFFISNLNIYNKKQHTTLFRLDCESRKLPQIAHANRGFVI